MNMTSIPERQGTDCLSPFGENAAAANPQLNANLMEVHFNLILPELSEFAKEIFL